MEKGDKICKLLAWLTRDGTDMFRRRQPLLGFQQGLHRVYDRAAWLLTIFNSYRGLLPISLPYGKYRSQVQRGSAADDSRMGNAAHAEWERCE
jgi:hypothetical protein